MACGPWSERGDPGSQSVLGLLGIHLGERKAKVWGCFPGASAGSR